MTKSKLFITTLFAIAALCLVSCGKKEIGIIGGADGPTSIVVTDSATSGSTVTVVDNTSTSTYSQISQEEAKHLMDTETNYVILDVREKSEYEAGHIPGALLLPHTQVEQLAPSLLPDKDQLVLVYCRTGRRSKLAAEALAKIGYTNIREFGGIVDWPYTIEN